MIAPGPSGVPVFGCLFEMRPDPLRFFIRQFRRYGDAVRIPFGPYVWHLLVDPEQVHHVLQKNVKNYTKQTRGFDSLRSVLGNGLVTSEGSFWLRQRRIAQPAFHKHETLALSGTMVQAAEGLAAEWEPRARAGSEIDVHRDMMRLTLRIIGLTMLSTDISNESGDLGRAVGDVLHEVQQRIYRLLQLPLWVPTPSNRRFLSSVAALDRVVYGIIGERRRNAATGAGRTVHDLLALLMAARDEETGEAMDDLQLRDEVMTIFMAGHETTANLLSWTWFLLSTHPEAGRRLRQELATVLAGRPPVVEDLPRLEFLGRVIEEALRLYPPAWIISRRVVADDRIGDWEVQADSYVVVCPYLTHRHPGYWTNPEGFDPDRFLPGAREGQPRFAYFPFGGGPRQCIGNHFATMEAQLILATLAQRFRLDLMPGQEIDPEAVITLRPRHGIPMTVHPA